MYKYNGSNIKNLREVVLFCFFYRGPFFFAKTLCGPINFRVRKNDNNKIGLVYKKKKTERPSTIYVHCAGQRQKIEHLRVLRRTHNF